MNKLFSATVSLTLLSSIGFFAEFAQANPQPSLLMAQQADAPQIDSFTVNSVEELTPGTELIFTLQGTPSSRATITLGNSATNLPMREVDLGVYEGRYTIRSSDRFSDSTVVRANLQQGDRVSSIRLQQPLVASQTTGSTSSTGSTSATANTAQPFYIDQFTAEPVQQLTPGTELIFTLVGTPNASATYSIEGVVADRPMQEIAEGTYRGEYVIRRQDTFSTSGANVVASLQGNGQVLRTRLDRALIATSGNSTGNTTATPLTLEVVSPQNNSRVSGTVDVQGRSAPNTTVDVSVKAINSLAGLVGFNRDIFDQSVQTNAQGDFEFSFQPGITVPGTRYEVTLRAASGTETREETLVLIQR